MPSRDEHRQAFDILAAQLRQGLQLTVRALDTHRGTSTGEVLAQQLDHTLQRHAHLYGRGTYENLSVGGIFATAVHQEGLLAYEYERERHALAEAGEETRNALAEAAARHTRRARALIDAARRARNVHVPGTVPLVMPYRGVYVTPYSTDVEAILMRADEPFVRWQQGAVVAVREDTMAEFEQAGAAVVILYFDADELYDDAYKLEAAALDAEFSRRLTTARTVGDRTVGDVFAHHINRLLLHQSIVLRNLQARLDTAHAAAHRALQPLVDENRDLLAAQLMAYPSWAPATLTSEEDALAEVAALERAMQAHVAAWVAHAEQDDPAGLLSKFQQVAAAGTLLGQLEAQRRAD